MSQERNAIIKALSPYFKVKELVCPHCYQKFNERSWQFLDTDLLHVLLILRESIICKPMIVNYTGHYQRGLRCNLCDLVKSKASVYLTMHSFGKAVDFTVPGMTAKEVRQLIISEANLLPCNIRLEDGVSWVHLDVMQQYGVNAKVYLFKA